MTKTLVVCRRELASLFERPLAWVLGAVFTLLAGYLFWSELAFFVLFGGASLPMGLWRFVFLDWRLITILILPALTMRLLAEERRQGTLELLWTLPVRDHELLLGKFLAAWGTYCLLLAATLVGPLVLHAFHPFAWPPVLAGYLGLALLGAVVVACGLFASAITEHQVVAVLITYGILVFLWFVTRNEAALGEVAALVLLQLSLFDHFYGFAQGVIALRDVVWMLAMTALFGFLALRALGARTWRGVA